MSNEHCKAPLGELTVETFLNDYWQQQPLLIRAAFAGFRDPLSPQQLAGLACDEDVSSRLIKAPTADGSDWQLRHGPFDDDDFARLADRDWTLLVQDVEKHWPSLTELLAPFRFIPDWRIDDLMISYAAPGGTVGPHWDEYDVFLLQGAGSRRWQISHQEVSEDNILDGQELRLLREFTPQQSWLLQPGDMLYLPPRVAHYGVAVEPAMTYSIGFRAPAGRELVAAFGDYLAARVDSQLRYRDPPGVAGGSSPGRIDAAALAELTALLRTQLSWDDATLADWFGRFITEAEPAFDPLPPERRSREAQLRGYLAGGGILQRAPGLRFAYTEASEQSDVWRLFIAGEVYPLRTAQSPLAPLLCDHYQYSGELLAPLLDQPATVALLLELLNQGCLHYDKDNDNHKHNDKD